MKVCGKRIISIAVAFALLASVYLVYGCNKNDYDVHAAVLYCGDSENTQYDAVYSQMQQSFVANLKVEKVDASKKRLNLDKYDIVYLDDTVSSKPELKDVFVDFVKNGKYLVVSNGLLKYFGADFFGASEIIKLNEMPTDITYPEVDEEFKGIREIIKDYQMIYVNFTDTERLSQLDYGFGLVADTAVSIADFNGVSLFGMNRYGAGKVFYVNPILPNAFHINSFEMKKTNDLQTAFCNSTATANQIILGEFASYVSKEKYGFSAKKVLGSFGNTDMAWQLHYEEITGIENNSAITFGELCKEYNTVPSFTLIRNTYKWFSKFESISYLLNDNGSYHIDINEDAYSSGTHVVENGKNLSLCEAENTGSYFEDNHEFMQMAYPYISDVDGDGTVDIVCGSSNGKFYYFEGEAFENKWLVGERQVLTNIDGYELSVGSYSAPVLLDYDYDGINDIVSGNEKGEIILFKGYDKTHFYDGEIIAKDLGVRRTMPYAGDIDNDGNVDLIVGSSDGKILVLTADGENTFSVAQTVTCENESFVAPYLYDYNDDGKVDLIYGTFDGYIRKLKNEGKNLFSDDGYYDTDEMNYKGNNHIKFGNNCVPRLVDINNDGADDLVAGELEYGLPIAIDSPYFAYRNQLQTQVDYMKENRFYLGVHFYTNQFASSTREREELRLHKRAFDTYAIDYDDVGVNMHTWRVSEFSPVQTIESARDAGFKWISCFRPSGSVATPDASAEFALTSPFFLDFEKRNMLIGNASVLGYRYDKFAYLSAKYDLPVSEYYHCDFIYENEQSGRNIAELLANYKKEHFYNFVKEDQLMKSVAAAYNMDLSVSGNLNSLKINSAPLKKDFDLYDKDYQKCTGIKMEFADRIDVSKVLIKADVWRYDEQKNALYVGLNDKVSLKLSGGDTGEDEGYKQIVKDKKHIVSVNIPADIKTDGKKVSVKFADDGMMQVLVAGKAENATQGWKKEYSDGITTFTKFGSESDLSFELE